MHADSHARGSLLRAIVRVVNQLSRDNPASSVHASALCSERRCSCLPLVTRTTPVVSPERLQLQGISSRQQRDTRDVMMQLREISRFALPSKCSRGLEAALPFEHRKAFEGPVCSSSGHARHTARENSTDAPDPSRRERERAKAVWSSSLEQHD